MSEYYAISNEQLQRKLDRIMRRIDEHYANGDGKGTPDVLKLLCQRDRVRGQMCNLAGRV